MPPRRYPHPQRRNFTTVDKRDPGVMDLVSEILQQRSNAKPKFLELAVFVDEAAYKLFMDFTKDEAKFSNIILGYINQVQALYLQPSMKEKVHVSLVHMELQEQQPNDLPHHDGNRDSLLSSFCKYQASRNPGDDSDPGHWDSALYLSGLNFYGMDGGKKNAVTMGLAPVGGVCHKDHNCVITEFGGTTDTGKPYPSAGWTSTFVAAHEIGHNLGMLHDGPPNNACPSDGYIMSPSRGTKGETTWSDCSSEVVIKMGDTSCLSDKPSGIQDALQHDKFGNLPGQEWDSHDQCKIFLRDEDAALFNSSVIGKVCERVTCKTPNRMGYYKAGPALEGTFCGDQKWCRNGKCVTAEDQSLVPVEGGWSDWSYGTCTSGCISNSKGFIRDHRSCDSPRPRNTAYYCDGDPFRIKLCDDNSLCSDRESAVSYASRKCEEWKKVVKDLSSTGTQVKHKEDRKWQACAVYCKFTNGPWYTPRAELNDLGDAFFPDGTWCHNDGKRDYYCRNHVCQPEAQGRSLFFRDVEGGADVPILGNAHPSDQEPSSSVRDFFSYDDDDTKSDNSLPKEEAPSEEEYTDDDYVSFA
ncbi:A disintegrin and metalloproteinase with thrombospondin motifs adt-1-like [Ornithodoros turicata]|uniref:A disintegrin and metalloproteinase with thrombospondin motifs adt-1-like n=1 Tax=Ornithodoros turicata TaxID=34597 RepID=UPI0031399C76